MDQQRSLNQQPRNKTSDTQGSNQANLNRGSSTRGRSTRVTSGRGHSSSGKHSNTRGNSSSFQPRSQSYISVPAYASIHSGSAVSIVLKVDQSTGHEVKGIVADLLTRGNHPRGVKVRLRDGRVGRVQGLVSPEEAERGEKIVGGEWAGLGRNGMLGKNGEMERSGGGAGRWGRGGRIERDIRENDGWFYDEEKRGDEGTEGLFKALEEADRRHAAGCRGEDVTGDDRRESASTGVIATCPVCDQFEGDERAVAHHVDGHFAV